MPPIGIVMLQLPTRESVLVHWIVARRGKAGVVDAPLRKDRIGVVGRVQIMLPRYDSQFHRSVSLFIEPEKSSTIATSRGR